CAVPSKVTTCTPETNFRGLSLCRNLLTHLSLQLFVWFTGLVALVGNICVIVQYFINSRRSVKVPHLLVANLALADFTTAIYLLILAVADLTYHGIYGSIFETWLKSWSCSIAMLLGTCSSLMSVLMMLIITIDRYICLVFPFSTRKLTASQSRYLILAAWITSFTFCIIPTITSINEDGDKRLHYFSSICMPSNVINVYYRAWIILYTIITIIAWFITAILYLAIFNSIRKSSKMIRRSTESKDKTIAFRLFIIIISDLVSWLPFYYTLYRAIIQQTSNVFEIQFVVIIALPINSAINPFIYTFT
ncbi:uncharacterized protein TRIADDRAFT_15334, partial [Trichoplax adhaerens]